jgi:hypothetical protein
MKFRSFFYALAAIVLALLLVSAGGAYWLAASTPLALVQVGTQASPAASTFVSKRSPVMVSLLVNPDRLASFWMVSAPLNQRRQVQRTLYRLRQNLLAKMQLDYEDDIQPWLGNELTLAVTTTDIDRDTANGQQPGYLIVATTDQPALAQETLQTFWQQQAADGTELVFESYAGVKLIYGKPDDTEKPSRSRKQAEQRDNAPIELTSAIVGDRFVLFANHPKVLRDAINNVQAPDLNLDSSPAYQDALANLSGRQIGLTFVNLSQLDAWLAETAEKAGWTQAIATPTAEPTFESLVMALEANRQGLRADTTLLPPADKLLTPSQPTLSAPVGAARYIPASSSLMAASTDLQHLWTQIETGLAGYPTLTALVQQPLAQLKQQWGIDLPDAVFSWVNEDFALGLVPSPDRQAPLDWVFVTRRSAETEAGLAQLNAIAQQQGISIGSVPLDNQTIFAWTKLSTTPLASTRTAKTKGLTSLQADVQGVRATIGEYEIFATSLEAMEQALQAPKHPLTATPDVQQSIAELDTPNNGYLYLDRATLRQASARSLPLVQALEQAAKPVLDSVRSIVLSSYGSETNGQRGALFIRLTDL